MLNFIFNSKKLGVVKTSTDVTMICHIRFSDGGQILQSSLKGMFINESLVWLLHYYFQRLVII